MKRFFLFGLLAIFLSGNFSPAFAEETKPQTATGNTPQVLVEFLPEKTADSLWSSIGKELALLTAAPISPLIGAGGFSAYQWWRADEVQRARLPWYATPLFFIPVLLLAAICIFKDTICASLPPGFKKPIDVVETIGNKLAGVLAAFVVIPYSVESLAVLIGKDVSNAVGFGEKTAGITHFSDAGLAMLPVASIELSTILYPVLFVIAVCIFFIVWMASHAINVLILLSPWGGIDVMLKSIRGLFLSAIIGTTAINPLLGAAVSLCVILLAYFVAGWSFRLTIFGTVFCSDFLLLRHRRFSPKADDNKLFAGRGIAGAKLRTYGHLINEPENGRLVFAYRPWLILPKKTCVVDTGETLFIGRGLFFSTIREGKATRFILPPRYRGHEEEFALRYGFGGGVREAGVLRVWGSVREIFNGGAIKA